MQPVRAVDLINHRNDGYSASNDCGKLPNKEPPNEQCPKLNPLSSPTDWLIGIPTADHNATYWSIKKTTPAGPPSINHHFEDKSCIRIISPCHNHQTKELYQWIDLKKIEPGKPWCLAPTWIFGFQMFPWLDQFWYVLRAWLNWDLLRFQRCDGIWILQACIHGLLTRFSSTSGLVECVQL